MVLKGPVPGGRKVGRKPAFTAADVVAAARAEGLDRFTMTAVASRLGVVTPAIYRLFTSREDLVIACLDAAAATFAEPGPGTPAREVLRLWADECWRLCEENQGLSRLVPSYPAAPTRIEHVFVAYADALAAHAVTTRQAMFALELLGNTVFATHFSVEAMRSVDARGRRGVDAVREIVGDKDVVFKPRESWAERHSLDVRVEFILDGLEVSWPEV